MLLPGIARSQAVTMLWFLYFDFYFALQENQLWFRLKPFVSCLEIEIKLTLLLHIFLDTYSLCAKFLFVNYFFVFTKYFPFNFFYQYVVILFVDTSNV